VLLTPSNLEELSRALAEASQRRAAITRVDLSHLSALVEHQPEDMTATVQAGMRLEDFQERLRKHGQWLPLDPGAAELTIGDLLAHDLSGPRRLGYGTVRDYLIGIRVALANGEVIRAGGKVVKNVAGYDLGKLFIGAKHSLGVIVEGTFKLRPVPEAEQIIEAAFPSLQPLEAAARQLLRSPAEPVLLDAHNLAGGLRLVAAFAGAREDVAYQLAIAREMAAWRELAEYRGTPILPPRKLSVAPSNVFNTLKTLGETRFVARLGNGIIYADAIDPNDAVPNRELAERVKEAYDPAGIFPAYTV
jgi:FAD/FMN-containing dehydrogenase